MGLLNRALLEDHDRKMGSGLMQRAVSASNDLKKKTDTQDTGREHVTKEIGTSTADSTVSRLGIPAIAIPPGYGFPFAMFDSFLETWPILKAALLFQDVNSGILAPWSSKNLDETSSRRLRIPRPFMERTLISPVSVFETQGLDAFKLFFSDSEFKTLRRLSFFKTQGSEVILMLAETTSSVPLDLRAIGYAFEAAGERLIDARKKIKSGSLADSVDVLDRQFSANRKKFDSSCLLLVSSESICDEILSTSPNLDMFRLHLDIAAIAGSLVANQGSVLPAKMPQFVVFMSSQTRINPELIVFQLSASISASLSLKSQVSLILERSLSLETETPGQALKPYL